MARPRKRRPRPRRGPAPGSGAVSADPSGETGATRGDPTSVATGAPSPPEPARLARPILAGLGVAALLSVVAPLVLGGRDGAWAFPAGLLSAEGLARGVVLTAALAGGLWLLAFCHDRLALAARIPAVVATVLALGGVMAVAVPLTYIGDWQWLLLIADEGQPLGKWYGSSLIYAWFHESMGRLGLGLTPLMSVRLCSGLCGAVTAYLYMLTVRRLGLTRTTWAWPFLYLSAFGIVGVGLGHLEVYAAVGVVLGLVLWTGVRLFDEPTPGAVLLFAGAAGLALASYVSMILLVPVVAGVLGFMAWRGHREGRGNLVGAAAAGVLLAALPLAMARSLGPEPLLGHLLDFWIGEAGRESAPDAPYFLPDDVFWPAVAHFMNPKYWFAGWHLRDIAQHALLDDRVGLTLLLVLVPGGLLLWRRGGKHPFGAEQTVPLALAVLFLGYGFALVNGRPYPWDWDLFSYGVLPASVAAAGLLAGAARGTRHGTAVSAMIAGVGILAAVSATTFAVATPVEPGEFGKPVGGLSMAVAPVDLDLRNDEPVHFWWFLRNETDERMIVTRGKLRFVLHMRSDDLVVRGLRRTKSMVGRRILRPGETAAFFDVAYTPSSARYAERPVTEKEFGEVSTKVRGYGPRGSYDAVFVFELGKTKGGEAPLLRTNRLAIEIVDDPAPFERAPGQVPSGDDEEEAVSDSAAPLPPEER